MIFIYRATSKTGEEQSGTIDAPNVNIAITSLQVRGLIILDIVGSDEDKWWTRFIPFGHRVKPKEIVLMSRQIATLFEAKVSALSAFRMLASESDNPVLRHTLTAVTDDIKSGLSISAALAKHPNVFSDFYVHMIEAGEESGKLSENFTYLANYLERSYELVSKAKNALIYPIFVIISFVVVMILMLVFVIPKLSAILEETGQKLPIYTRAIIGLSHFFVHYGFFLFLLLVILFFFLRRYFLTKRGSQGLARFKISVPYVGELYRKIYLARIADNLSTMITSGISMVRAIEISAAVVGNEVYKQILVEAGESIKSGSQMSAILTKYPEVPNIMVQMIRVGEETGKLGFVLDTLSRFYKREVDDSIRTLVDLIEPAMIGMLGLMVGLLLVSVLMPIYNLAEAI